MIKLFINKKAHRNDGLFLLLVRKPKVEDNKIDNAIVVYPNPAQDIVIFANTSGILLNQAVIYDVNGKQISIIDLSDMQQEKTVDVSNLSSGVYMVQFQSDDASTVKRLVKE